MRIVKGKIDSEICFHKINVLFHWRYYYRPLYIELMLCFKAIANEEKQIGEKNAENQLIKLIL
jgi:hypothetical protein